MVRPLPQPMLARAAAELPSGGRWAYEPTADGVRALATVRAGRARLRSRQQRPLTSFFPEVVEALAARFADVELDGELVVCRGGRLDFTALQRRLTGSRRAAAAAPASYLVFDALAAGGTDLCTYPYEVRRVVLQQLLDDAEPPLALVPMTTDLAGARAWLTQHADAGIEGVVAKDMRHGYRPGKRTWTKVRTRSTAEAVVGGVIGPVTAPSALLLGRPDGHGRLRVAGRTIPLPRAASDELAAVLSPAVGGHPWPETIPSGRVGLPGGDPVRYTPVRPEVVVELSVDTAEEAGRWRHGAVYQRLRLDLQVGDLG